MKNLFTDFIEKLSTAKLPANAFNQYAVGNDVNNSIRRKNLLLYFWQMAQLNPQILLVGEAPSYQGCRLTGVPFCSEFILLDGIKEIDIFGESKGYRKTGEFERVRKEPSATIVWGLLARLESIPLLWNAFPFHPFKAKNAWSNRPPTSVELKIGENYLEGIIQIFDINLIVALGNKAALTLRNMDYPHKKVRHPSQGGKNDFITGISEIVKNTR